MKTSKVFAEAKKLLARDYHLVGSKEMFICFALDAVGDQGRAPVSKVKQCRSIIQLRLGVATSLECWLKNNCGIEWGRGMDYDVAWNKMQTTRHAWLDALIAEYQAKGD